LQGESQMSAPDALTQATTDAKAVTAMDHTAGTQGGADNAYKLLMKEYAAFQANGNSGDQTTYFKDLTSQLKASGVLPDVSVAWADESLSNKNSSIGKELDPTGVGRIFQDGLNTVAITSMNSTNPLDILNEAFASSLSQGSNFKADSTTIDNRAAALTASTLNGVENNISNNDAKEQSLEMYKPLYANKSELLTSLDTLSHPGSQPDGKIGASDMTTWIQNYDINLAAGTGGTLYTAANLACVEGLQAQLQKINSNLPGSMQIPLPVPSASDYAAATSDPKFIAFQASLNPAASTQSPSETTLNPPANTQPPSDTTLDPAANSQSVSLSPSEALSVITGQQLAGTHQPIKDSNGSQVSLTESNGTTVQLTETDGTLTDSNGNQILGTDNLPITVLSESDGQVSLQDQGKPGVSKQGVSINESDDGSAIALYNQAPSGANSGSGPSQNLIPATGANSGAAAQVPTGAELSTLEADATVQSGGSYWASAEKILPNNVQAEQELVAAMEQIDNPGGDPQSDGLVYTGTHLITDLNISKIMEALNSDSAAYQALAPTTQPATQPIAQAQPSTQLVAPNTSAPTSMLA
jgi:hypothetical protein